MKFSIEDVKKLREESGAGVLEVKKALDEADGDVTKAKEIIMKKAGAKAAKKSERQIKDGLVISYIHSGGKIGSLISLGCETDFVAKTDEFKMLGKEIAMQVCTDDYEKIEDLLKSEYIRDGSKTIQDLINEAIAKIGENIELKDFVKFNVLD